jgi:hypothetical protein
MTGREAVAVADMAHLRHDEMRRDFRFRWESGRAADITTMTEIEHGGCDIDRHSQKKSRSSSFGFLRRKNDGGWEHSHGASLGGCGVVCATSLVFMRVRAATLSFVSLSGRSRTPPINRIDDAVATSREGHRSLGERMRTPRAA